MRKQKRAIFISFSFIKRKNSHLGQCLTLIIYRTILVFKYFLFILLEIMGFDRIGQGDDCLGRIVLIDVDLLDGTDLIDVGFLDGIGLVAGEILQIIYNTL